MHKFLLLLQLEKTKKIFFAIAFVLAASFVSAQQKNKPKFKTIIFASYDYNHPFQETKDQIELKAYYLINEKGILHVVTEDQTLSVQLSDGMTDTLNKMFCNGNSLLKHRLRTELEKGMHYAGSYDYVSCTLLNNKTESLCYITPFMSEEFIELEKALVDIVRKIPEEKAQPGARNQKLAATIQALHKKSKLPAIELPPPQMEGN